MDWFYISFVDVTEPKARFAGACLVRANDEESAIAESHVRGCNPGGEAAVVWIEPELGEPPVELQYVLFRTKEELSIKFASWLGAQGARTETIAEREARGGELHAAFACAQCNAGVPHQHN